jgi:hypothetical protein
MPHATVDLQGPRQGQRARGQRQGRGDRGLFLDALCTVLTTCARHCFCFTYIAPPNGHIQRPKPVGLPLGMSNTNATKHEATTRSEEHDNWPMCDVRPARALRAAPPPRASGGYGIWSVVLEVVSGENGHLACAQMGRPVVYAAHQPVTWPRPGVFGRRWEPRAESRWLVSGRGGGWWVWGPRSCTRARTRGAWGASAIRVA